MTRRGDVPVLEVGGSHVTGALVRPGDWTVHDARRLPVRPDADAQRILDTFVAAGSHLNVGAGECWGVAMPDPFDYEMGIALFDGVGKFDTLHGVDVGAVLSRRLPGAPARVAFVNDADAFVLGEWVHGCASGKRRCVGITLGTGVGSGWLVDGAIATSGAGVPREGRAHHLVIDGAPLEQTFSSRALRAAYALATGDRETDVLEIADRARAGDEAAVDLLRTATRKLGAALAPAIREFGAEIVVVGGSMTGSWDLLGPWFEQGLDWPTAPPVLLSQRVDTAALIGAAALVVGVC